MPTTPAARDVSPDRYSVRITGPDGSPRARGQAMKDDPDAPRMLGAALSGQLGQGWTGRPLTRRSAAPGSMPSSPRGRQPYRGQR